MINLVPLKCDVQSYTLPILVSDTHCYNCSLIQHLPYLCFVNLFSLNHVTKSILPNETGTKNTRGHFISVGTRKTLPGTENTKGNQKTYSSSTQTDSRDKKNKFLGTRNTDLNRKHHGDKKNQSGKMTPREGKTPFREQKTRSPTVLVASLSAPEFNFMKLYVLCCGSVGHMLGVCWARVALRPKDPFSLQRDISFSIFSNISYCRVSRTRAAPRVPAVAGGCCCWRRCCGCGCLLLMMEVMRVILAEFHYCLKSFRTKNTVPLFLAPRRPRTTVFTFFFPSGAKITVFTMFFGRNLAEHLYLRSFQHVGK